MIESFTISNYMSFRDKTELSFLASKKEGSLDQYQTLWYKDIGDKRILKLLIGVGLNASGKSKMISGLSYLRRLVTVRPDNPNLKPEFRPFKLDSTSINKPTEMWLNFYVEETRYEYYIKVSRERIEEEELKMQRLNARSQRLYYRAYNLASGTVDVQFGQFCDISRKDQRNLYINIFNNATVLSQFGFMNLESQQLRSVYDFFHNRISRVRPSDRSLADKLDTGDAEHDQKIKNLLLQLLKDVGSNIVDYHIETATIGLESLLEKGAPSSLVDALRQQSPDGVFKQKILLFEHKTSNGIGTLDLKSESDGTIGIIKLLVVLYDVVIGKKCTCIDELGDGLHQIALEYILRTYLEMADDCQVLFVTHSLPLLASTNFHIRRDSIRKFSKNEEGVTTVVRQEYIHKTVNFYNKYMEELEKQLQDSISKRTLPDGYESLEK